MNTLTLPASSQLTTPITCPALRVYVNGQPDRRLQVLRWEIAPAPDFGKALLTLAGPDPSSISHCHADPSALPPIGAVVSLRASDDGNSEQFCGVVTSHDFVADESGRQLAAECEHRLTALLSQRISALWRLVNSQPAQFSQTRVRFNADQDSLAGETIETLDGRDCRLFDSAETARFWSAGEALAYLLASEVDEQIEAPSRDELLDLADDVELKRIDITGKTVAEALAMLAKLGGLEIRAARHGLGLVFYRPGAIGRPRSVRLQAPGETFSPDKSNLWKGSVRISRRPARGGVVVLGQPKQYECTFELKKGWDPSLETSRWRDFVRSQADDWPQTADVYRKWILNEHGWYASNPWNLPVYSFDSISSEDFIAAAPRKLLPSVHRRTRQEPRHRGRSPQRPGG